MREIKYRAWNDLENKWCNFDLQDLVIGSAAGFWVHLKCWGQYTGLKDKNNHEIYEGDIVRYCTYEGEDIAQIAATLGKQNLYFQWINQETNIPSLMTATDYFGCASELEVIGNIHENPGLLD